MLETELALLRQIRRGFIFFIFFLCALAGASPPSHALLLLEEMVYIGPKAGAATFKIKNTTQRAEAYRMEWVNLKMDPEGRKKMMAPGETMPGVMPAQDYMYLSPRRLMLMPDQLQHLRLMVRRPSDLPPGEYRSYMVFSPEPVPKAFDPANPQVKVSQRTEATMDLLTGFRIPVFFLQGETVLNIAVINPGYGRNQQGKDGIHFIFAREGTRSAIGKMEANCMAGEQPVRLSETRIQIFTELPSLDYFMPVSDIPPGCSVATLDYMPHPADPDYTGFPVRMAEIPLR